MNQEHDYVHNLLPWYLNGSLHENDTNRVNAHLEQCDTCTLALQEEIKIAQQLQQEPPAMQQLLAHKEHNFAQLKTRLELSKKVRPWRLNIPQVAALILITGFVGFFGARLANDGDYVTLSRTATSDATVLQIMIQSNATERELRQLLLNTDAKLLNGPSQKGVYRLQLPADVDTAAYAKRLREHPAIRYVEEELN
ncbi:MAG: anti-sigma factor family protein [Pseudomonadales bacterium]